MVHSCIMLSSESSFVVASVLILLSCMVGETRRSKHNHDNVPVSFGTISDKFEEPFREGQKFMKHELDNPHKNRGWKHGRKGSSEESGSGSSSRSSSRESSHRSRKKHDKDDAKSSSDPKKSYEQQFKEFVKSHGCENSPVYRKFLQYYKQAIANLKQKGNPHKFETPWLVELANNIPSSNGEGGGQSANNDKKNSSDGGVPAPASLPTAAPVIASPPAPVEATIKT